MANTASSKKRIRTNAANNAVNTARTSRIRTFLKKVEVAIASGDAKAATDAYKAVQPQLMRGISKGIVEKNAVARKMSRLNARIKAIAKSA